MNSRDDADLALIQRAISRGAWRSAWLVAALALGGTFAMIRFVSEGNLGVALLTSAPLFSIAGFILYFSAIRNLPSRSRVVRALIGNPEAIDVVEYYTSSSSSGAMVMHWLRVTSGVAHIAFQIGESEAVVLGQAFARRCGHASVTVPGFNRIPKTGA